MFFVVDQRRSSFFNVEFSEKTSINLASFLSSEIFTNSRLFKFELFLHIAVSNLDSAADNEGGSRFWIDIFISAVFWSSEISNCADN